MIQVAVHGAEGRMGRLVAGLVDSSDRHELVGLISEPGRGLAQDPVFSDLPLIAQETAADQLPPGCVIVDFSVAGALAGLLVAASRLGSGLVIGTTGYSAEQLQQLRDFSSELPVVHAANFSVGIPTLKMVLQLLARTLPAGFGAEQIETHHTAKLDRPSGTAIHLQDTYRAARGGEPVPTHSQRLGGVIGEHTWTFCDDEETLVITHRAHSRGAFLRGILPAVDFVAGSENGLFDLQDVLLKMGNES